MLSSYRSTIYDDKIDYILKEKQIIVNWNLLKYRLDDTIKVGDKMNAFLIILFIIIILGLTVGVLYIYFYNKINDTIIRVNEAENRIDDNLRDKYDILSRSITLVKSKVEVDDKIFNDLAKLKTKKISNFELDRILVATYNELLSICDNHKELRDSDELYRSMKQLDLIDEELVTLRNYYNANITNYNKMIKKIPTLLIAKLKKYNERLFYDMKERNDEDYEDFKL